LNSKFNSYYVKQLITTTHTLQIDDGRLIPIKISPSRYLSNIIRLVDEIITTKRLDFTQDTTEVESKLDQLIYELYGLNEEEIEIIESSIKWDHRR